MLGTKTNKDLNNLRHEKGLNYNGKYKPEKYKALQKQRLNERKIRQEKEEIQRNELLYSLNQTDTRIKSKILKSEALVKKYQAEQRELAEEYKNIERRYDREQIPNPLKEVIFTDRDNDRYIGRKKLGVSQKSFEEITSISQQMLTKKEKSVIKEIEEKSDPRLYYENCLVRKYYHERLKTIKDSIPKNLTIEDQAMFAFSARNNIRLEARTKMVDLKALSLLPENSTFEKFIESKMQRKNMTREEALVNTIETSDKSNGTFDRLFKED